MFGKTAAQDQNNQQNNSLDLGYPPVNNTNNDNINSQSDKDSMPEPKLRMNPPTNGNNENGVNSTNSIADMMTSSTPQENKLPDITLPGNDTPQSPAMPAQDLGYIDKDELQKSSTPAQNLSAEEQRRKELEELIKRQEAAKMQDEPIKEYIEPDLAQKEEELKVGEDQDAAEAENQLPPLDIKTEEDSAKAASDEDENADTIPAEEEAEVEEDLPMPAAETLPSEVVTDEMTVDESPAEIEASDSIESQDETKQPSDSQQMEEKESPAAAPSEDALEEKVKSLEERVRKVEEQIEKWV